MRLEFDVESCNTISSLDMKKGVLYEIVSGPGGESDIRTAIIIRAEKLILCLRSGNYRPLEKHLLVRELPKGAKVTLIQD